MSKQSIKLPYLDPGTDREYVLNWVGLSRRVGTVFEVFVRLVDGTGRGAALDRWIPFDQFPFLILGSEWRRGTPVRLPVNSRSVTIQASQSSTWHSPTRSPKYGGLDFGAAYALAFDSPASPVLEVSASGGQEILYVPLSEILRTHYLFEPRLLPSFLGGLLAFGQLSSANLEAWDPARTRWLDEKERFAQIRRAKFISDYIAKRLARLLFDPYGKANLLALRRWIERHFLTSSHGPRREIRADLPKLGLPYAKGGWTIVSRPLSRSADGRRRSLVLRILSFEAAEPYRALSLLEDFTEVEPGSGGAELPPTEEHGGKLINPIPPDVLPLDEPYSGGYVSTINIDDIVCVDKASQRRHVIKPPNPGPDTDRPARSVGSEYVDSGSLQLSGPGGANVGPVVLTDGDEWPPRARELSNVAEMMIDALRRLVVAHRRVDIDAAYEFLPNNTQSYSFKIPKNETEHALLRARARQFLVLQVRIANRYAYIVEPQRLFKADAFPVGVWVTYDPPTKSVSGIRFSSEDIELIASEFEKAHREGRSWVGRSEATSQYLSSSVRHPPRMLPSQGAMDGFGERVAYAVHRLIGDARADGGID